MARCDLAEPELHQCCQSVGDGDVGLSKWKGLYLSQHPTQTRDVVMESEELEAPHSCQLVADREVGFPKKKGVT